MADKTLDTRGLRCPMPILKTKKAIREVPRGGTLEVLSTDPGSVLDFEAFCQVTGHGLIEQSTSAGIFRFVIRRTD